jgi:beta-phosphoglucomutase-like phosphatase (HAD superfamily)
MLDAVLLDWENVLVDTTGARRDALRRALSEEGVPVPTDSGDLAAVLQLLGDKDPTLVELVTVRAARAFAEHLGKGFVLRPGARELVEHVQAASRLAIVTAATRAETEYVLRLAGLDAAASTIVSADDTDAAPPSPAGYRRALDQLSRRRAVHPDRVVAIAATPASLLGARAAGMRTLAFELPAHAAVEAHGALGDLTGLSVADLAAAAGIAGAEYRT